MPPFTPWSHPEIETPDKFSLADKDYDDFKNYLRKKNFNYKTVTEQSLNELIESAKKEKYYDLHSELFTELEKDLTHSLDQDLTVFRKEITSLLENEIVSRYYYEEGAIKLMLKDDEQVLKAIEVLNNKSLYAGILSGSNKNKAAENIVALPEAKKGGI